VRSAYTIRGEIDAARHLSAYIRAGWRYSSDVSGSVDGETGMYLIREALEGLLEPRIASHVIFEALERGGIESLPSDASLLIGFVEGPLRAATADRAGEATAADVVERLTSVLMKAVALDVEVPVGAGPVRVMVMGRGSSLAVRLRAALGGDRVAIGASTATPAAEHMLNTLRPEIIILDAVDPIQDPVEEVAGFLARTPAKTTRLVWGREQPWASRLEAALDQATIPYTPVDRRDGVEPLLDLIRARPRSFG
jgi:hypothetical protein